MFSHILFNSHSKMLQKETDISTVSYLQWVSMKTKALKRRSDAGQTEKVEERLSQEKYSLSFTLYEASETKLIRTEHQKLSHYLTFSSWAICYSWFCFGGGFFPFE